ncbi:MAG: hypothetical protein AAFV19_14540 [Pseudomonadota bacterium]
MMRIALAAVLLVLSGGAEAQTRGCPEKSRNLLFHSCWGDASAEVLLLPEDADRVVADEAERKTVVVTGAYTGKDTRSNGAHNPVGLFIDGGAVVNPNLARMDGIVLINDGQSVSIEIRSAVDLGEAEYDLTEPETRMAFAKQASERGFSVFQSHLLIKNGALDVRQTENAPVAVRRMLFTDDLGWGLWQTDGVATLYAAADGFLTEHGPVMALNLDMGSYDYCIEYGGPAVRNCGVLAAADTAKLSNLLRLSFVAEP